MNKQVKKKNGIVTGKGIEWTDYTWNPVGGCKHRCRWAIGHGQIAKCYAEEVAHGVARAAYEDGFFAHYWRPDRLGEPLKITRPARIFLDSMSDLMGHWVPDEQIKAVLSVCKKANWHTFQLLTKNAPRLLKFDIPGNVWVGVSMPPDFMWGKPLNRDQQVRMLDKSLVVLGELDNNVTWLSAEPLSWDISEIVYCNPNTLDWVVIGAASNGKTKYQPEPQHVENLLSVLDERHIPAFFKGNLEWKPHREDYPDPFLGFDRKYCLYCGQYLNDLANYDGQFCNQEHSFAYEIPF